jgi:hypothetical protein
MNPRPAVLWAGVQAGLFALLAGGLVYFSYLVLRIHHDFLPDAAARADFGNLWRAGLLARHGRLGQLYAPPLFEPWDQAAPGAPPGDWIYPPEILPLGVLLSLLAVPAAFIGWSLCSLAAMGLLLRGAGLPWAVIALTLASPAEYRCLSYGQLGGLLGCLAFRGLLAAAGRPALAGVMIGLLSLKPPAGGLVLAAWLAGRNGRAIVWAAFTALLLGLVPLAWFGPDCWGWFVARSLPMARQYVQGPFPQSFQLGGVSVFWMFRGFGCGIAAAYAGQAAAALGAFAAVFGAWRRPGADRLACAALTVVLMLFVTPYAFTADMVGFELALAVLAWRRGWKLTLLDGVLWLWPGYSPLVTAVTGLALTPLLVALAAVMAWRQARA